MNVKEVEDIGYASLHKCVIAPRKMRLVADSIRRKNVFYALTLLDCEQKKCAVYLKKLLLSAVTNYQTNCERFKKSPVDKKDLIISTITVDGDGMLKRLLPASQGRGFRKRRRSSNVFIVVADNKKITTQQLVGENNIKKTKNKNIITNNTSQS